MNKNIVIASKSKIKQQVVAEVLSALYTTEKFTIIAVDAEVGGPEPVGEEATLQQITTALEKAKNMNPGGALYVAMEGGVKETDEGMEEVAFVVIEDEKSRKSISRSVSFPIPEKVASKIRKGISLADAVDETYSTSDIKNNQGFVGLLTNGVVDKKALYYQPTVIALSKYLKSEWFW